MPFSIHTIYRYIFKLWRSKRHDLFLSMIKPQSTDKLLDIGGLPRYWIGLTQTVDQVDCLNIHSVKWEPENFPNHNIRTLVGDGCELDMTDNSYDIAFSNSVIEHVGSWERQKEFAAEISRVAHRMWIQTPAYECPIEPHFLAPFVHWLPVSIRKFAVRFSLWGLIQHPTVEQVNHLVETTQLLTYRQVKELFPDCHVIVERMFGFIPKSYIIVRTEESAASFQKTQKSAFKS
jgi:hypothetical protein